MSECMWLSLQDGANQPVSKYGNLACLSTENKRVESKRGIWDSVDTKFVP